MLCDLNNCSVVLFFRKITLFIIFHVKVVLCANSRPALNDVTYNELTILARRVADLSEDINAALTEGRLLVMESGQGSPCLDLRYCPLLDCNIISFMLIGLHIVGVSMFDCRQ